MPEWLAVPLGIVGGFVVLGGALYLAVRPEFQRKRREPWFPKADQAHREKTSTTIRACTDLIRRAAPMASPSRQRVRWCAIAVGAVDWRARRERTSDALTASRSG